MINSKLKKPDLLTVDDAFGMNQKSLLKIFSDHMNPGQLHFMKILGFHKILIRQAEGMYYFDNDGKKIIDFCGGAFGAAGLGHNHPRILKVRKRFQDEKRHEISVSFISQYAAVLSKNLASISPGDLEYVFLCTSGSEAIEASLKLAEQYQGIKKSKIIYAENSFHGKTLGALSVTDGKLYRSNFRLLNNCVCIPFGSLNVLRNTLMSDPEIGIFIIETIQGGAGIIVPDDIYLQEARRICDEYNVLFILDEVQSGMGRTGKFFAFEHANIIPDIVAIAKSLGGGKVAMGAMIARKHIFMKSYGKPKTALIHAPSTFGAMGEAACTAIETLNILYDEGLIENARVNGEYLIDRLNEIKLKYPDIIKEIRGRGLMVGVEFNDISQTLPFGLRQIISKMDDKLKGSLCGFIGSLLLKDHNILVAFTEYNRNVIRLEPPLLIQIKEIDTLIESLDTLLSKGIFRIVSRFLKSQIA
jgi:acetylornithine/succinyldiaminopimelate/putrescine aminotransferase